MFIGFKEMIEIFISDRFVNARNHITMRPRPKWARYILDKPSRSASLANNDGIPGFIRIVPIPGRLCATIEYRDFPDFEQLFSVQLLACCCTTHLSERLIGDTVWAERVDKGLEAAHDEMGAQVGVPCELGGKRVFVAHSRNCVSSKVWTSR